jgi:ABC-2 type transport system permease protein
MGSIFRLSLHQLAERRRLLIILLLAILPVAVAAIVSAFVGGDESHDATSVNDLWANLVDALLVAAILPIVMIALSTAAFGDEVEDRTLSYLVLKPISRVRIVLPKLLASIAFGGPLLIVSGVAATLLGLDGSVQAGVAVGVALGAGVVAYSAIFTWAGLISTRALAFGLIYVLLWEGLFSTFLDGVRYFSVRAYTLAILHGIDENHFEALGERAIEFPAGIAGVVAVTVVFFFLAVRRLGRMDVP